MKAMAVVVTALCCALIGMPLEVRAGSSGVARVAGKWNMTFVMPVVTISGGAYTQSFEHGGAPVDLVPASGKVAFDIAITKNGQVLDRWTVSLEDAQGTPEKCLLTAILHGDKKDYTIVDKLPLRYSESSGFTSSESEPAADGAKVKASITFDEKGSHTWTFDEHGPHKMSFTRR